MAGITSYGAYIPLYRLSGDTFARAWGMQYTAGERAVAFYDEDSVTMAAAVWPCTPIRWRLGVFIRITKKTCHGP